MLRDIQDKQKRPTFTSQSFFMKSIHEIINEFLNYKNVYFELPL